MQLDEILKMIDKKVKLLQRLLDCPNKEFEFIEEFMSHNLFSKIEDVIKIDLDDLAIAYLTSHRRSVSFEKIRTVVKLSSKNFNLFDVNLFSDVMQYNDVQENMQNMGKKSLNIIFQEKLISRRLPKNQLDTQDYLDVITDTKDTDAFLEIIALRKIIEEIREKYNTTFSNFSKENGNDIKISSKYSKKLAQREIHGEYNMKAIRTMLMQIQNYYGTLQSNENAKKRNLKKQITNLQKSEELLREYKIFELQELEKIVVLIEDTDILSKVLKYINSMHEEMQQVLLEKYQRLSQIMNIEYQYVLKENGISYSTLDNHQKSIICKYKLDDLKEILKILNEFQYSKESMLFILENTSLEIAQQILNFVKEGILSSGFVQNNSILFLDCQEGYGRLIQNINCIIRFGLNPRTFVENQSIFVLDSSILEKNLTILSEYLLLTSVRNCTDYSFLKTPHDLDRKIDLWLELGYEEELESCLDLLNRSEQTINRIRILKDLQIPIEGIEELQKILDDSTFIITDCELQNYLWNVVPYRIGQETVMEGEGGTFEGNIVSLEKYLNSSRTYKIGDSIFSKQRVQKNYSSLINCDLEEETKIWNALVYGTVLQEEEWDDVRKELYGERLKKI